MKIHYFNKNRYKIHLPCELLKESMNTIIKKIIFLLVGGLALALSGINWHIGIAAWIAPVFLLLFTRKAKWSGFLLFFAVVSIAGGISQTCNNLLHLPQINIFNGITYGIAISIPYIVDRLLYRNKFVQTLIFPASVAIVEFFASFAIGTWGSIVHTQYGFSPLMQLSSVTGIFGIWFLLSWFASVVVFIIDNRDNRIAIKNGTIAFGSVFVLISVFGLIRTNSSENTDNVKVATIVSETDINDYVDCFAQLASDNNYEIPDYVFSDSLAVHTLIDRTITASEQGAKIIVWNELALFLTQTQKQQLVDNVKAICKEKKLYVLLAFGEKCIEEEKKPFNNVSVLVSPKGEIEWDYKKSFLQPTAEAPIINAGDFNLPVVQTEYGKLGNVICADLDMLHYIKQAGEKSVDILLVPAFDWEEITPLHSRMAAIQAIQFGCHIVRSNGKGLSAVYNDKGKEIVSLNNLQSGDEIMYAELPIISAKTVYSCIGDVFVFAGVVFILIIIVLNIMNSRKIRKK